MKSIAAVFFLILSSLQSFSQIYDENYEVLNTRDGLSHNIVLSILQDREGYMWIGTYNGLCRYDGYEFKIYDHELNPTEKGVTYTVDAIFEDRNGNIWIGTRGGLIARLDKKTNTWKRFHKDNQIISVNGFYEDDSSTIWVSTRDGKLVKIIPSGTWSVEKEFPFSIIGMLAWGKGKMLVMAGQTHLYDIHTRQTSLFPSFKDPRSSRLDPSKNILAVRYESMFMFFDKTNQSVKSVAIPAEFTQENFWFNFPSKNKLILCNLEFFQVFDLNTERHRLYRISDHVFYDKKAPVNTMFKDRNGLLWIGTNTGLMIVDEAKYRFKKYSTHHVQNKIPNNYVRTLYFTGDTLWVGSKTNLPFFIVFNTDHNIKSYQSCHIKTKWVAGGKATINTFFRDSKGRLWAGGLEGLFLWNNKTHGFEAVLEAGGIDSGPAINEIWSITGDNGKLWIGTNKYGLYLFDPETRKIEQHYPPKGQEYPASVWNLYRDAKGQLFAGSDLGLLKFVKNGKKLVFEAQGKLPGYQENGGHVWNIIEDRAGNMWLGTTDKSIDILDNKNQIFRHLDFSSGLPSNAISGLIMDHFGNIWISQTNGLASYHSKTGTITRFSEEDGLLSNDFNFKSCAISPWGELFFGTKVGMISFIPQNITGSHVVSSVVSLLSVKTNKSDYNFLARPDSVLEMNFQDNFINVRFALLNFRQLRNHKFRFKMIGLEKDWNFTDFASPSAVYSQLPPGSYTLLIEGSSDGINWNNTPARLNILIHPGWWQSTWFIVLSVLLIMGGISTYIFFRIRWVVKREKEQSDINKKIAELELKALQAQMNPHFIFNAVNSIQHFIFKKDVLAANDYLSRFARLMRLILESSKKKYITVKDEIELLNLYLSLEYLRFEEKFTYQVIIDERVPLKAEIPSMLVQPFIENAINHGLIHRENGEGRLTLSLKYDEQAKALVFTVEDNGIGREKAQAIKLLSKKQHESMGMSIIDERIKTYQHANDLMIDIQVTDLYDENNLAGGTRIQLIIPIEP